MWACRRRLQSGESLETGPLEGCGYERIDAGRVSITPSRLGKEGAPVGYGVSSRRWV